MWWWHYSPSWMYFEGLLIYWETFSEENLPSSMHNINRLCTWCVPQMNSSQWSSKSTLKERGRKGGKEKKVKILKFWRSLMNKKTSRTSMNINYYGQLFICDFLFFFISVWVFLAKHHCTWQLCTAGILRYN